MTVYQIDPDNRRTPKTDCYCIQCGKDIVNVNNSIPVSVDWDKMTAWPDQNGDYRVGKDCWHSVKNSPIQ